LSITALHTSYTETGFAEFAPQFASPFGAGVTVILRAKVSRLVMQFKLDHYREPH
jgi:hypothetical protein